MSYSTVAQFRSYAFPSGSFDNMSNGMIQHQLDNAASLIDVALRPYHTLPLDVVNVASGSSQHSTWHFVSQCEMTIASYYLMMYRGFKPNIDGSPDQILYNRYLEITNPTDGLLTQLKKGEILLEKEADATPTIREKRSKMYGRAGRVVRYYDADGIEYF